MSIEMCAGAWSLLRDLHFPIIWGKNMLQKGNWDNGKSLVKTFETDEVQFDKEYHFDAAKIRTRWYHETTLEWE